MARRKGFEPPTFWFVAKHSIQLSYRRISYCPSILSQIFQKINTKFKNKFRIADFFADRLLFLMKNAIRSGPCLTLDYRRMLFQAFRLKVLINETV